MTELAVQLVTISPEEEGQRLDNFLLKWAKGVPKSHIYRIIRSGEVRINKKRALVTSRILSGDIIRIPPIRIAIPEIVPNAHKNTLNAIKIDKNLSILHEDDHLLITEHNTELEKDVLAFIITLDSLYSEQLYR